MEAYPAFLLSRSWRKLARNVWLRQWPYSAKPRRRLPVGPQPLSGTMLALIPFATGLELMAPGLSIVVDMHQGRHARRRNWQKNVNPGLHSSSAMRILRAGL